MYYKKLVNKRKLIKFWIFLGGDFKGIFKVNYTVLNFLYQKYAFTNIRTLLKSVKALLPVFLNLSENKASNVLFVATKALYSKSVFLNEYKSLVKRVSNRKPGVFTNFSICGMSIFNKLDFKNIPSMLVFFYFEEKDPIFLEAKKKCIPVVSFIDSKVNPVGVDYPVIVNTGYFYTAYFFSKFLFNLLRLKKN